MTWAVTTVYFILTPLMGLVYYLYVVSIIYEERPQLKPMVLAGVIPAVFYAGLVQMCIRDRFTPKAYHSEKRPANP